MHQALGKVQENVWGEIADTKFTENRDGERQVDAEVTREYIRWRLGKIWDVEIKVVKAGQKVDKLDQSAPARA